MLVNNSGVGQPGDVLLKDERIEIINKIIDVNVYIHTMKRRKSFPFPLPHGQSRLERDRFYI